MYIGEPEYISKGLGSALIKAFLQEYVLKEFKAVFVDPDASNKSAVRVYEKAGFKAVKRIDMDIWMVYS